MTESEPLERLKGLLQDLRAFAECRLMDLDRLHQNLEATVGDFQQLLEAPPKRDASRRAVQTGTKPRFLDQPRLYLPYVRAIH
jgi:hypothetical protein